MTGIYNDKVFEDRDVAFTVGEGEADDVIDGVDYAVTKFRKGEKSKLKIKSKYAYGPEGNAELGIPPNADLEYIVEVKSFEKGVQLWSLDGPQKVEQAKMMKNKGTTYFKNNKLHVAIKMYKKVVELTNDPYDYEDILGLRNELLLSANLNLGLCFLKTKEWLDAKEACTKALELDPKNEKALFRRGQAYLELAAPELALKDFEEVLKIEPKNTSAIKQVAYCRSLMQKELAKEKKLYANMFEKFAKEDKKVCV